MATTRLYTIPLRREFAKASHKRKTNKAVTALREFITKHMKADRVVIGEELNETMWARGITNPPAKIKVEVTSDVVEKDDVKFIEAFVNLPGVARKVVSQSKKGVLSKESSGGLKGKLAEAVADLKGTKAPSEPTKVGASPKTVAVEAVAENTASSSDAPKTGTKATSKSTSEAKAPGKASAKETKNKPAKSQTE